jgi:hypothetical protein
VVTPGWYHINKIWSSFRISIRSINYHEPPDRKTHSTCWYRSKVSSLQKYTSAVYHLSFFFR